MCGAVYHGTARLQLSPQQNRALPCVCFFRHLVCGVEAGRTRWWSCGWEKKGWMGREVASRPPGTVSIVVRLFFHVDPGMTWCTGSYIQCFFIVRFFCCFPHVTTLALPSHLSVLWPLVHWSYMSVTTSCTRSGGKTNYSNNIDGEDACVSEPSPNKRMCFVSCRKKQSSAKAPLVC